MKNILVWTRSVLLIIQYIYTHIIASISPIKSLYHQYIGQNAFISECHYSDRHMQPVTHTLFAFVCEDPFPRPAIMNILVDEITVAFIVQYIYSSHVASLLRACIIKIYIGHHKEAFFFDSCNKHYT